MKRNYLVTSAILFVISSATYFMFTYDGSVRTVEFLSVFAIGTLFGVLLTQLFQKVKGKGKVV